MLLLPSCGFLWARGSVHTFSLCTRAGDWKGNWAPVGSFWSGAHNGPENQSVQVKVCGVGVGGCSDRRKRVRSGKQRGSCCGEGIPGRRYCVSKGMELGIAGLSY